MLVVAAGAPSCLEGRDKTHLSLDNKLDELRSEMTLKTVTRFGFHGNLARKLCSRGALHLPTGLDNTFREEQGRGGVCFMVNNKWCSDVEIISTGCSPDLEHLMIRCRPYYRPYYLPRLCAQPSAVLYSLFTHDCDLATHSSNTIVKFADDTTVIGLITGNDEMRPTERSQTAALLPPQAAGGSTWTPRILCSFYRCTIESILTGCITAWYSSCTALN
ncbi:hypothetical protein L3Q82_013446, partial [Scortum barcoo]